MRGRNILEGVVILHETIHEMHRKRLNGVILKIDFEKAYDKVKWPFLFQTLRMKGFSPKWISWVKSFIMGGSVAVNVNDDVKKFFQTKKGLQQGDPLCPLLFNIVADMLAILINGAKEHGQVSGVVPHLIDGGLSILQYADDTIIFMENDLEKARNMKLLLCAFEQVSGLKINFHKSEILCFGNARDSLESYLELFGCKQGDFPIKYLGMPIHFKKLRNSDWNIVEERVEKRLASWKGKHLSIGGRLTLINSVLSSLSMYMMSFFAIPKGVLKKLNYFRSRFFWQGDESKRKYRLARWNILCQPNDQGGFGIHDLNIKNTALLSKWLFKLLTLDGTWQQLLRNKYLGSKPLVQVDWKTGDSHFWSSLMKVKQDFLRFGTFKIKNGSQGLKDRYPGLYSIARKNFITIAEALTDTYRSSFFLEKNINWAELSQEDDTFHWSLTQSGQFSMKSHYQALIKNEVPNLNKRLWKLKAPLKIKVFLWYLRIGVILTKDNLANRNWHGDISRCFCHKPEIIKHLFLECRFARMVIYATSHWLRTWAVLQKADQQATVVEAT
ncbi:hypothetical protein U9M48_026841 [Paspalum notatum var. saurae]|uniref:Reverse transcriptase domain-containing protein n=1 Tax=Paspalum notatum var. saurae TaxID=547442 RepID=A0AAQ3TW32_PASNO